MIGLVVLLFEVEKQRFGVLGVARRGRVPPLGGGSIRSLSFSCQYLGPVWRGQPMRSYWPETAFRLFDLSTAEMRSGLESGKLDVALSVGQRRETRGLKWTPLAVFAEELHRVFA
jgi:hypothetical protein